LADLRNAQLLDLETNSFAVELVRNPPFIGLQTEDKICVRLAEGTLNGLESTEELAGCASLFPDYFAFVAFSAPGYHTLGVAGIVFTNERAALEPSSSTCSAFCNARHSHRFRTDRCLDNGGPFLGMRDFFQNVLPK
jgi:hypothetical protein